MDVGLKEKAPDADMIKQYANLDGVPLLNAMIKDEFPGRIVATSSFGTEAAVLLDMVAQVAPATPIVFLDTGLLFPETLEYRDTLIAQLGLTDVRTVFPDPAHIKKHDADGDLHEKDSDTCCHFRKILPLDKALKGFDAWITGRKRFHGGERTGLATMEMAQGRTKINPLAGWSAEQIEETFKKRNLPRHPLVNAGYGSVGCAPCTSLTGENAGSRDGRWQDKEKTECGIHNAPWFGQGI